MPPPARAASSQSRRPTRALSKGIPRNLAKQATEIARQQGSFTIYALVDALTRLTQQAKFVGDRVEADAKAASLLALAA